MTLKNTLLALSLSAATLAAPSAMAVTLYANDFDSAATIGTGVAAAGLTNGGLEGATAGVWNGSGWAGNYFANRSTGNPAAMSQLTLTGLQTHTTVSASFILGFLESWDSFNGGCCAPDNLDVFIDGVKVATLTANNALGTIEEFGGGTLIPGAHYVQANGNFGWSDTLVDMSSAGFLTFAHTASTLTLGFQASGAGWQGGGDEAWGIDKINIQYNGRAPTTGDVPEPSSAALLGVALLALAARRRKAD